jgi:hypothetical protein
VEFSLVQKGFFLFLALVAIGYVAFVLVRAINLFRNSSADDDMY